MLYQLHWQFRDGKTEMRTQFKISDHLNDTSKRLQLTQRVEEANKKHPKPDGVEWMLCSEKSEKFVMMAAT